MTALGYRQEIGAIKDYVESLHDRKSRNICAIDKLKREIDSLNDDSGNWLTILPSDW